jgi:polyphenol oxidase
MATRVGEKRPARRKGVAARKKLSRHSSWTLRRSAGLQILQSAQLDKCGWLVHGLSTRQGGASSLDEKSAGRGSNHGSKKGPERVLNLGFTDWDSHENVMANRADFFRAIGTDKMRIVALKQIHSDIVHCVSAAKSHNGGQAQATDAPTADGLITQEPGVLLVVQTADCVPILLADTRTRAVAAVHSGWRGTLRRIAEKTLGRMQIEFGTRPEDVVAAIGPAIGRCCYEVGSEVAKEFHSQFADARKWFDGPFDALAAGENDPNWLPWLTMKPPGHQPPAPTVQLDLPAANRAMLEGAGVPPERIFCSDFCTACRTDLFFSYRRERVTGRLMAAIGIR